MSRIGRPSPALLLALGLLVGALLGPHAASAAGETLTAIVGRDGSTRADVTAGNRLLTTEAEPNRMHAARIVYLPVEKGCKTFVVPPTGRGSIVRQFTLAVVGKTAGVKTVHFYDDAPGAACTGPIVHTAVVANVGNMVLPQTPGLVIQPGRVLRVKTPGEMHLFVQALGYSIPSSGF